jgi:hypothetical protein
MNTANTVIKVIPGRFPQGGFVAALIMGGAVVVDCWGQTKGEARAEVKRAAKEMGFGAGAVRL